jgi:hypothetical protein
VGNVYHVASEGPWLADLILTHILQSDKIKDEHTRIVGSKDHLTIFIYDPIVSDPEGMINQGQGNLTARATQVRQHETINTHVLLNLFQAIIANNRAGGWRKLKGSQ